MTTIARVTSDQHQGLHRDTLLLDDLSCDCCVKYRVRACAINSIPPPLLEQLVLNIKARILQLDELMRTHTHLTYLNVRLMVKLRRANG